MLIGDKVNSAPSSAGHNLRPMMTPLQNYRGWRRWMPPSREGVASTGGFRHCPAAILSCPWGLLEWLGWLFSSL